MLFTTTLALAVALPALVSGYTYNSQTKLYHIGEVPMEGHRAALWQDECGGDDIHKCTGWDDGKAYLRRSETCMWAGTGYGGQCSRNQRRKGKKFYPFVDGKKAVCVTTEQLQS
jgi:hypothetical protein